MRIKIDADWKDNFAKVVADITKKATKTASALQNKNSKKKYKKSNTYKMTSSKKKVSKTDSVLQEIKSFCLDNTPVVVAGVSLVLVSAMGVFCLANMDKSIIGFDFKTKAEKPEIQMVQEIEVLTEAPDDVLEEPDVKPVFTLDALKNLKFDQRFAVDCYGLFVDNKEIAYVKTKEDGQLILDTIESTYLDEDSVVEESYFGEDVEILPIRKDIAIFKGYETSDELTKLILRGTDEEQIHEVAKGENYWLIAKQYNISVDNLIQANPQINPDRLQIGQQISLVVPKPLISVVTKEIKEYSEDIPFEVAYEDSGNYYKGEVSVKKAGVKGERKVVAEVYKENGIEKERVIVKEQIISEAVTKIVYKGTKNPPPRIGTGTFSKPTNRGTISSPYGMRWGRRHTGIDIAIPIGTDVKAADGGVVTYAGDNGAYGKCVIIDHGANMSTLYAHNSQILVKKGDKVFKGQTISKSGNTGRSTGPHLHFEVRKNNVPTNPTAYVNY